MQLTVYLGAINPETSKPLSRKRGMPDRLANVDRAPLVDNDAGFRSIDSGQFGNQQRIH
jgi:hypothetical protein